ncbi:hypothetical protein EDB83DRAFT_2537582 [Lactarius deliciosus]|nr:hypothetical protein EDB83DRAFT_2537582 [Lactarius deliciosus]
MFEDFLELKAERHLTEDDRNAAFWYGFHPDDREVVWPRLLSKNPFQPSDVPFHFEDVFVCARAAFTYDSSSFWSHAKQFQSPSLRREQPVVEPTPRNAYSFRTVTCAVASNAETTTIPDELPSISPSPYSMPDTQLSSSFSPSASESHQTQVPSVTLDQPEPAYTFSTTLPPSASPSPTHTHSLAPLAANVTEISSIPLSSPTLAPFSMPISSDFEYLPSVTVDQPEHAPTLLSTPPSSSTFLASPVSMRSEMNFQPEPESASRHAPFFVFGRAHEVRVPVSINGSVATAQEFGRSGTPEKYQNDWGARQLARGRTELQQEDQSKLESTPTSFASVPRLTSTPSHVHSVIDNFASTPPSLSPTSSTFLPSPARLETEDHPEPESATTPSSPALLSAPSLTLTITDDDPELESAPLPFSCPYLPPPLSASLVRSEVPTSLSPPTKPSPSKSPTSVPAHSLPPLRPSPGESCCNRVLEPFATPASSYPPESPPSSLDEPIPFLPAPVEPIPRSSMTSQRSLIVTSIGSDCSALEVTPALTLPATPFVSQSQQPLLVYKFSSTLTPGLPLTSRPSLPLSRSGLVYFNFASALVSMSVLISTFLDISATTFTLASTFWSKQETGSDFAQRFRLGNLTPRVPRLVFDPGGPASSSTFAPDLGTRRRSQAQVKDMQHFHRPAQHSQPSHARSIDQLIVFDPGGQPSSSSFRLPSAREDVCKRKTMTRGGCTTLDAVLSLTFPIPVPIDNLIVFDHWHRIGFVLEPAHEYSATFDEDGR